jgi:hypothetical protein
VLSLLTNQQAAEKHNPEGLISVTQVVEERHTILRRAAHEIIKLPFLSRWLPCPSFKVLSFDTILCPGREDNFDLVEKRYPSVFDWHLETNLLIHK